VSGEDLCLERGVTGLVQEALAACGRSAGVRRAEQKTDDEPLEDLPFLEAIVRPANVAECALGRVDTRPCASIQVVGLAHEPPGTGEAKVVADVVEDHNRLLRRLDDLGRGHVRHREEAQETALHERMSGQLSVARRCRGFDSLRQDAVGPAEVGEALDDSDVRHELYPQ
jgi:hypothetical protein